MIWYQLNSRKKFHDYVTHFNFRLLELAKLKHILKLGFPSALQFFFEVAIFTSAIWLSGVLGKNAQAANQIALNLSSMTYMVGMGLGVVAMIRVGNQKGLKDYFNLRRIAQSVFLLTLFFEIIFAIFFLFGRDFLPTIYLDTTDVVNQLDNIEVITLGAELLLIAAFFQISDGLQVAILGALRGLQDVNIPTLLIFIAYWVVGFPLCYYLGLHTALKSVGIWIGLLAGLSASALLLYLRFNYLTKRLLLSNPS